MTSPWSLLAIDKWLREPDPRYARYWLALSGLITLSQILMGYPPNLLFCLLLEGWYILVCLPFTNRRQISFLVSIKTFGLVAGAAQLLPTIASIRDSNRAVRGFDFLSFGSLYPLNFLQLGNPYSFEWVAYRSDGYLEQQMYPGIGILLLAAWSMLSKWENLFQRRLVRGLAFLGSIPLFLSLGKFNLGFYIYHRFPVLNLFRCPSRYLYFFLISVVFLATLAIDRYIGERSLLNRRGLRWCIGCIIVLTSASLLLLMLTQVLPVSADGRILGRIMIAEIGAPSKVLLGAALVTTFVLAFLISRSSGDSFRKCFVVLSLLEIFSYHLALVRDLPVTTLPELKSSLVRPPVDPPAVLGQAVGHFFSQTPNACGISPNSVGLLGYGSTVGYASLEPRTVHSMKSPIYHRLFGADVIADAKGLWHRIPNPLPLGWFKDQVLVSKDPKQDVTEQRLRTVAVLEKHAAVDPSARGTLEVEKLTDEHYRIHSLASGPKLVAFRMRYSPGWKAITSDGEKEVYRVDGQILGFVAPAGSHDIDLVFDPAELRLGIWVSLIGLTGIFAVAAMSGRWFRHTRLPELAAEEWDPPAARPESGFAD